MSSPVTCVVCGQADLDPFMTLEGAPVFCNVLWGSREDALATPRGSIELALCPSCAMIQNLAFDPAIASYAEGYENSLHFSPTFQEYARSLAARLASRHDLAGKTVVEIGSGQGEFLAMLCELGGARGVGYDPSLPPSPDQPSPVVSLVADSYSDAYGGIPADFVLFRHVLEHLAHPAGLLATLRRALGEALDVPVYCEVPAAEHMLRLARVWDVIFEHPSYFTAAALQRLFVESRFRVVDLGTAFSDQYLWLEALPNGARSGVSSGTPATPSSVADLVPGFVEESSQRIDWWATELEHRRSRGERVALWGIGSKGVTFLNLVDGAEDIDVVVDVNGRKHEKYVPGTGQLVQAPEALRELRPSLIVITNPVYEAEIVSWTREMGIAALVEVA